MVTADSERRRRRGIQREFEVSHSLGTLPMNKPHSARRMRRELQRCFRPQALCVL